jgi:NOL1/NOP2/sun family putative RNA methylase
LLRAGTVSQQGLWLKLMTAPSNADLQGTQISSTVDRYRSLLDDPDAFLACVATPQPTTLWVNPLKAQPDILAPYFADHGLALQALSGLPGGYTCDGLVQPGTPLPYAAGWYYVQEAIAMTAVAALDPQPGERVLDLCAAPGGKALQIAARVGPAGLVVANDFDAGRLASLSSHIQRLGFTNIVTTQQDGRAGTFPPGWFDRVLVDAPCSGEGTLRRRQRTRPWRPRHSQRIRRVQQQLLANALHWVKPGGTVVYSTCTFAPEENEAVLDAVMGDRATCLPFDLPDLRHQPGLPHWQGQSFRADLSHAHRYWPHFNNTGGFFVARLRRSDVDCSKQPPLPGNEGTMTAMALPLPSPLAALGDRFGLPKPVLGNSHGWFTGRRLWLSTVPVEALRSLPPLQTWGLAIASPTRHGWKPSTAFLQRFGPAVERNRIEFTTADQAQTFLQGQAQSLTAEVTPGFVHGQYGPFHLGCGSYRDGVLRSYLPKAFWATRL